MPTATSNPESAFAETPGELDRVTGVHLMQGVGHRPAKGFWAEAWDQVLRRRGAVAGIVWISIVGFFAVFAPFVANGRPIVMRTGEGPEATLISPLLRGLTAIDIMLVVGAIVGLLWMFWPKGPARSFRLATLIVASLQAGLIALVATVVEQRVSGVDVSDRVRAMEQSDAFVPVASALIALVCSAPFMFASPIRSILPSMGGLDLAPLVVLIGIAALQIVIANNVAYM